MIRILLLLVAAVPRVEADPELMHQIDVSFVCPENLPSEQARIEALAKFDADMATAVKNVTIAQLADARMYLLKKHHCYATLENIRRNSVQE